MITAKISKITIKNSKAKRERKLKDTKVGRKKENIIREKTKIRGKKITNELIKNKERITKTG